MMAGVRDRWQALLDEGGPILADGAMGNIGRSLVKQRRVPSTPRLEKSFAVTR